MPHSGVTYLTIQKRIVMDAVKRMPTLFTARDLCDALAASQPRVSRATVYRVIAIMRDEGSIRELWFPSGKRVCINSEEVLVRIVECADCGDLKCENGAELSPIIKDTGDQLMLQATLHVKVRCPLRSSCGVAKAQQACETTSTAATYEES